MTKQSELPLEQYRLLAVDDDEGIIHLISKRLRRQGLVISTASSCEEALNTLRREPHHLLLLDYCIRNETARDFLKRMREENLNIPFIVLTGRGDEQTAVYMLREGALDYINKDSNFYEHLTQSTLRALQQIHQENELERAKKHVENVNARMQFVLEMSSQGFWEVNHQSQEIIYDKIYAKLIQESNPAFSSSVDEWFAHVHPDDRSMVQDQWNTFINQTPHIFEYEYRLLLGHHDDEFRWFHHQGKFVEGSGNGDLARSIHALQDITEKRFEEQKNAKLELKLQEAQKIDTIGTLAGGIAHDFNNILSVILGFSELGLSKHAQNQPTQDELEKILSSAKRARELVRQILTFSRRNEVTKEPVDLEQVFQETTQMLQATLPSSISITFENRTPHAMVLGNETQIHQVLLNLATNASHAIQGPNGFIHILLKEARSERGTGLSEPNMLHLSVQDNGGGMDNSTLQRIFDPFFTTKGQGKGTGLGLSVVHRIVTDLKGTMEVESTLGKGSTFHIYLPRHIPEEPTQKVTPEPAGEPADDAPQTDEPISLSVLVVDDESLIADVVGIILKKFGHEVSTYVDPNEALNVFQQNPESFSLVISDLTMPGLTGIDLAKQIRKLSPDLPIILTSGYAEMVTDEVIKELNITKVMQKPITFNDLIEAVALVCKTA